VYAFPQVGRRLFVRIFLAGVWGMAVAVAGGCRTIESFGACQPGPEEFALLEVSPNVTIHSLDGRRAPRLSWLRSRRMLLPTGYHRLAVVYRELRGRMFTRSTAPTEVSFVAEKGHSYGLEYVRYLFDGTNVFTSEEIARQCARADTNSLIFVTVLRLSDADGGGRPVRCVVPMNRFGEHEWRTGWQPFVVDWSARQLIPNAEPVRQAIVDFCLEQGQDHSTAAPDFDDGRPAVRPAPTHPRQAPVTAPKRLGEEAHVNQHILSH